MNEIIPEERIESKILLIRGQKVMLDRDLAELYGVETKYLNRQVRRNKERFPQEFMFRLTKKEKEQLVTNWHRFEPLKHSGSLPNVFTEHGVAMLASVLRSERAVKISIFIIKAFVKLRELLSTHKEVSRKLKELEQRIEGHDGEIKSIFDAIRKLMEPSGQGAKGKIGFVGGTKGLSRD